MAKPSTGKKVLTGGVTLFTDKVGKYLTYTNDNDDMLIKDFDNMVNHPTISIGIEIASALHSTYDWHLTGTNKRIVAETEKMLRDFWTIFSSDCQASAMPYGFAPFQKIWTEKIGKYVITKMNPLKPHYITIMSNKEGDFKGLKQEFESGTDTKNPVYLSVDESFVYPYNYTFKDFY